MLLAIRLFSMVYAVCPKQESGRLNRMLVILMRGL